MKPEEMPLDILMLTQLRKAETNGFFWKPLSDEALRIALNLPASVVSSKEWGILLQDLERQGLAEKFIKELESLDRKVYGLDYKTRTRYRISPKGLKLLEELGV